MKDILDVIENLEDGLEVIKEEAELALEAGSKTIGTSENHSKKVERKREDCKKEIEKLNILLDSRDIEYFDSEKTKENLKVIKESPKLAELASSIDTVLDEIRKLKAYKEVEGISEYPESVETIFEILEEDFQSEVEELKEVYGNSLSTAFLLRRILEKSIFLSCVQNGESEVIRDSEGKLLGLKDMINEVRGYEYEPGKKILHQRTGKKVQDVKFLGDIAAHNFSRTVSMDEIDKEVHKLKGALEELPITES